MGLSLLKKIVKNGFYKAPEKSYLHFRHILSCFIDHVNKGKALTEQEEERLKKLRTECSSFLRMKAYESFSYTHLLSILTDTWKKTGMPQVGNKMWFYFKYTHYVIPK